MSYKITRSISINSDVWDSLKEHSTNTKQSISQIIEESLAIALPDLQACKNSTKQQSFKEWKARRYENQ